MELTLGLFFGVIIGLILQLGEGNELLGWSCRLVQFSAIIPRIIIEVLIYNLNYLLNSIN